MPTTKKRPKRQPIAHEKRRVDLQLSVTFHVPRGYAPTANLVKEAIAYRIEQDDDPPHIRVRLIGWNWTDRHGTRHHRAPENSTAERAAWTRFKRMIDATTITTTLSD